MRQHLRQEPDRVGGRDEAQGVGGSGVTPHLQSGVVTLPRLSEPQFPLL